MSPKQIRKLRRPTARISRASLIALIVGFGYFALADTTATVMAKYDPVKAHALAPWDGRITARAGEDLLLKGSNGGGATSADFARKALQQDPTAVSALNVLGLFAQARNDTGEAKRIFAYSLELSRRELPARLWAIEESIARGDIRQTLVNYDIALTTSKRAPATLFPVLAPALKEPKIRKLVIEFLRGGATWGEPFIHYVSASGSDPMATAEFLKAAEQAGLAVQDGDRTRVVDALYNHGKQDMAWEWYAYFRKGASRAQSRNGQFTTDFDAPSVFDWRTAETPGITASIQAFNGGGLVDVFIAPGASGPVLSQAQALPPGHYRLTGKITGFDGQITSRPYWMLTCGDGREAARVVIPPRTGVFESNFIIQQDCAWQKLTLMARSGGNISGLAGQIETVLLRPLS